MPWDRAQALAYPSFLATSVRATHRASTGETRLQPRTWSFLIVAILIAPSLGACSGGSSNSTDATEKDFSIELGTDSLDAGEATFNISNEGPSTHEFVVFKTDLPEADLPTIKEGGAVIVDEEGKGVEHIDEVEDIGDGESADLTVDLDPGNYVVICNLPLHYKQGMHASLSVK